MTKDDITALLSEVLHDALMGAETITLRDLLVKAGVYADDLDAMENLLGMVYMTTRETASRMGPNAITLGHIVLITVIYRMARDGKLTIPTPVVDA